MSEVIVCLGAKLSVRITQSNIDGARSGSDKDCEIFWLNLKAEDGIDFLSRRAGTVSRAADGARSRKQSMRIA